MNRPNGKSESWEIRLRFFQVIILLGVVTGCLALSFLLGFKAGGRAGYVKAMDDSISNATKIPIASQVPSEDSVSHTEQTVTDVYANLKEKSKPASETDKSVDSPIPEISEIKEAQSSEALKDHADLSSSLEMVHNQNSKNTKEESGSKPLSDPWSSKPSAGTLEPKVLGDAQVAPPKQQAPKPTPTVKPTVAEKKVSDNKVSDGAAVVTEGAVIPKGWFAQVSAQNSKADADSLVTKLKSSGFKVFIEDANVHGEDYFRILVGPEDTRAHAEALVEQLSREKYLKGAPFIRMIK